MHVCGRGLCRFYSSNCIIGQSSTLSEYCDAIADAGVLVCEPGTLSYGLGALVLGRVCEVGMPCTDWCSLSLFSLLLGVDHVG